MTTERTPTSAKHWEKAIVAERTLVTFPAWGYIEGFEVRLLEPGPNMDASVPWRAFGEILAPDGSRPKFEVIGQFRTVE